MERNTNIIIRVAVLLNLVLLPLIVLFLWNENLNSDLRINAGKFGVFGDFFGGVVGSIWTLCSVLLFYNALKEQRRDFKNNRIALDKQVEALTIQAEEFRLQREEFKQSREVFKEQSKTLMEQRFDSIFFSMIELYRNVVSDLNNEHQDGDYFKSVKSRVVSLYLSNGSPESRGHEAYEEVISTEDGQLQLYFRVFYRLIKSIDQSNLKDRDKFVYIKIVRSLLSESQLFIIYYNSFSNDAGGLYRMVLKYNLLKHFSDCYKLHFLSFTKDTLDSQNGLDEQVQARALACFGQEVKEATRSFLSKMQIELLNEFEDSYRESYIFSLDEGVSIAFSSEYRNDFEFKIVTSERDKVKATFGLSSDCFINFVKLVLSELLIYGVYYEPDDVEIMGSILENCLDYEFNVCGFKNLIFCDDLV
ncbi:hypothetical protein CWC22_020285 [Pseudoalteromonas rubra]|uniref:Phage abortive infection protein n=1 Tax=Pseudoalteromonas rubra TaxID=43658 RepID=A0A5S3UYG0_9GAMM|nr:putative phage abortive infection protein [Pseudoalteromonas rubra]QPB85365.1 hypothetical protein CWC22_020285 [Pseudoalteromonas rubra]